MVNAFVIMIIILCFYAIIAVEFFSEIGLEYCNQTGSIVDECGEGDSLEVTQWGIGNGTCSQTRCMYYQYIELEGDDGPHVVSAITARGYRYGEEYYGCFSRALYTLWQVPARAPACAGSVAG